MEDDELSNLQSLERESKKFMQLYEDKKYELSFEQLRSEKLQTENQLLKETNQQLARKKKKIEIHQSTLLLEIISKLRKITTSPYENIESNYEKAKQRLVQRFMDDLSCTAWCDAPYLKGFK